VRERVRAGKVVFKMAAFGQQQSRLVEGQITQKIYGLIRDGKFGNAIELLTQQLQVCRQHSKGSAALWRVLCRTVPKQLDRSSIPSSADEV
jgi:hypothetical protein